MQELFQTQVTAAAVVVWLLQWLKNSKFPWVSSITDKTNRALSALAAAAVAVGVRWDFDLDKGTLLVTGLTIAAALSFLGQFVSQFAFQELIYRGTVKKPNGLTIVVPPVKGEAQ